MIVWEDDEVLLDVRNLSVHFHLDEGILKAVDGISFKIRRGRTTGLLGESGCGKSVTAQALLQIVPKPGVVTGEIYYRKYEGTEITDIGALHPMGPVVRGIRGAEIGMIFQEPMKAFSPIHTIGNQIMETLLLHNKASKKDARAITLDLLGKVGISNPVQRIDEYPYQLSGGMRQRAMIAMALCCNPTILIADEPTTALDVTIQAQVLKLMKELQADLGMAMIFITHDLGVISEMADDAVIMYLGKIMETCDVDTLFFEPMHPYTKALLESIPEVGKPARTILNTIEGTVPTPLNLPAGCVFQSRCKYAIDGKCNAREPREIEIKKGHKVRCFLYE